MKRHHRPLPAPRPRLKPAPAAAHRERKLAKEKPAPKAEVGAEFFADFLALAMTLPAGQWEKL